MSTEVDQDILKALAACPAGLRRKGLFPLCDTAGDESDVGTAIKRLRDDGFVVIASERHGNMGAVYALSEAFAETIHGYQVGHELADSLAANGNGDSTAENSSVAAASMGLSGLVDNPDPLEVDHFDVIMKSLVAIKSQAKPVRVVDNLEVKLQCLDRLQLILNPEVAELLSEIAVDLEAAC